MAMEIINNGLFDNDPDADTLRVAFGKTNANFEELYGFANNRVLWRPIGLIPGDGPATPEDVVNKITTAGIFIPVGAISTPVVIEVLKFTGNVSFKYLFLFASGKGNWGYSGTAVVPHSFKLISTARLTPEDVEKDPNAVIENLDPVVDGDFVSKANQTVWDFSDSQEPQEDGGVKSYYFTYTENGALNFALFKGTPGIYGGLGTPFTSDMFAITTNSNAVPTITKTSQLQNDGEGITPFAVIDYAKTITVGVGGDYATLENLFTTEPPGQTLIKLNDKVYNCVNPKFVLKEGWILKGLGIGRTKINFTFTLPIDPDTSGLHARQTGRMEDLEITTINNTDPGGLGQYAFHSDYPTYSFEFKVSRCSFRTIINPEQVDANGFNGLVVGLGSWEGQNIEFEDCFLDGKSIGLDPAYTLNLHNKYTASEHLLPSRVTFRNSLISGGFTALLISDVYSNDAEPNQNRVQDLYSFPGCVIKGGLYLRSHSQLGTIDKKNGIIFNFSGASIDEFISVDEVVDTSLSNYTIKSLPVTQDVEYQKNLGSVTINTGDFVCYVYENRLPEYHLDPSETIYTPIGVEKLNSTNIKHFAGLSLVTSAQNDFLHLAKGAIAYTNATSTTINVGDNVTFSESGQLIKAWFGGIGVVRKKTFDNRLGIELSPKGEKTRDVGSYDTRGMFIINGKANTVGAPTFFLDDDGYIWGMTNGVNSNSPTPVQKGRFALSDFTKGLERIGVDKDGNVLVTGTLTVVREESDTSDSFSIIKLGSTPKPGLIRFFSGAEIYQDPVSKTIQFNIDSTTIGFTVNAAKQVTIAAGTSPGHAVTLSQITPKTVNIGFASLGSHAYDEQTFAFEGAVLGDCVDIFPPAALNNPKVFFSAWVSSTGNVTARATNSDTPNVTFSPGDFKIRIIK